MSHKKMLSELLKLFRISGRHEAAGLPKLEWAFSHYVVGNMNPALETALLKFIDEERTKKNVKRSKKLRASAGTADLVHLHGLRNQPPRSPKTPKPKVGFKPTEH